MSNGKKKTKNKGSKSEELAALAQPKTGGLENTKRQLKTASKVAVIAAIVIWLLAAGFQSGLDSMIPIYIAGTLTVIGILGALLIRRNLRKSEDMGALLAGAGDLSDEDRQQRIDKLEASSKGDATAILAKAQLQMQESPREALVTLETVNLEKAQKMVAAQVALCAA